MPVYKTESIDWREQRKNPENTRSQRFTVSIDGVGNIGSAVAHYILYTFPNVIINLKSGRPISEQKLQEIVAELGNGLYLSSEEAKKRIRLYETSDGVTSFDAAKNPLPGRERFLDSDIMVFTARNSKVPFSDFKDRDDEYYANREMIREEAPRCEGYQGRVLFATNSLELAGEEFARLSKIPRNRIILASYIDTLRFRTKLAEEIKRVKKYNLTEENLRRAFVLGEHGPTMVPIYSLLRFGHRKFLRDPQVDSDGLRKRINQVLKRDPTKLQVEENSVKNVRVPAIAIVQTIEAMISGAAKFVGGFDGDCFITGLCRSKLEEAPDSKIMVEERDDRLLDEITRNEFRRYQQSKDEVLKRLKAVGLEKKYV